MIPSMWTGAEALPGKSGVHWDNEGGCGIGGSLVRTSQRRDKYDFLCIDDFLIAFSVQQKSETIQKHWLEVSPPGPGPT